MDNTLSKHDQLYIARQAVTDIHNYLLIENIPLPPDFNADLYDYFSKIDYYLQLESQFTPGDWNALDISDLLTDKFFVTLTTKYALSSEDLDILRKKQEKCRYNPFIKDTVHDNKKLSQNQGPKTDTLQGPKSDTLKNSIYNTIMNNTPTPRNSGPKPSATTNAPQNQTLENTEDYLAYGGEEYIDEPTDSPPDWVTESIPGT